MIDQQLIDMLDDPNPQVRSNAVKELAKTKSQEAVQYLAAIYKTDSDPEVRELARKGGLYIKKKMTEEKWTGGDPDPDAVVDEPEPVEEIEVSARAVESSKGNMDTAMNLHVAGDDEKAATYVERAFTTNPNLKNDPYYLGLAATILGVPGNQVADLLLGDIEYGPKGKPKRKRKVSEDDVSTEKVIIDLVIFWIVTAAILIIGTLILFQLFSNLFDGVMSSPEFTEGMSAAEIAEAEDQIAIALNVFLGAGLITTVVWSAVYSVFMVIGLLLQYALFHFSATSILGGDGTFKGLIHRLTNFYTITYAAYFIFIYFMTFQFVNQFALTPDDPEAAFRIMNMMSSGLFLAFLVWVFFLSKRIGSNYEFGTGKGCITIIISYVLMMAFVCACSVVFSTVMGQMMTNLMMSSGNGF